MALVVGGKCEILQRGTGRNQPLHSTTLPFHNSIMLLSQPQQNDRQNDAQGNGEPDGPFVATGPERENDAQNNRRQQSHRHDDDQPAKKGSRVPRRGPRGIILLDMDAVESADEISRVAHAFSPVGVDRLVPAGRHVKNQQGSEETAEIEVNATKQLHNSRPFFGGVQPAEIPPVCKLRCDSQRHSGTNGTKIFWPTFKLVSLSPGLLSWISCSVVFLPCLLNSLLWALTMASRVFSGLIS